MKLRLTSLLLVAATAVVAGVRDDLSPSDLDRAR